MIAIVLAGGRASRMGGGDKGLRTVGGRAILERVIAALAVQCDHILINANGDPARFAGFGHHVVADSVAGQPGPLAGLLAGLDHVADHHPHAGFALTVPGDAPFLPADLVGRLEDRRVADRAEIVHARSGEHAHPLVALWSVALRNDLRRALVAEGIRKVGVFTARHPFATVTWPSEPIDPFLNINTPEDLAAAERIAASRVADR